MEYASGVAKKEPGRQVLLPTKVIGVALEFGGALGALQAYATLMQAGSEKP
jgi:hypothetical protein